MSENKANETVSRGAVPPRRWMVVQTTALLESVATGNIACYGRGGVPRYPLSPTPPEPQPEIATLCVEVHLQAPDGTTRLALLDLDFTQSEQSKERTIWSVYDAARRLQIIWIWDFYRILSHIILRIGVPQEGQTSDALWQSMLDIARAMGKGDVLTLKVQSRCGNIQQQHTLTRAPYEWSREA